MGSDNRPKKQRRIMAQGMNTPNALTRPQVGRNIPGETTVKVSEKEGRHSRYRRLTFETLPDDVLVEIFDLYVDEAEDADGWHTLVHVCRRWRNLVFASPHHLGLQLLCTDTRPTRVMLAVWPPLPIIITNSGDLMLLVRGAGNIIAALQQRDRVCEIDLQNVPWWLSETFATLMQEPFPVLTSLTLGLYDEWARLLPNSPLCESAPRLRKLSLDHIPLPAIQRLLLSASNLVHLTLCNIPRSGYISPVALITYLSAMTRLEFLQLAFRSPPSHSDRTSGHPPLLTRTVFPALISLRFKGVSEYLEDLVARIDVPQLHNFKIVFFNQLTFDMSRIFQFVCRCKKFSKLDQADIVLSKRFVNLKLSPQVESLDGTMFSLKILCTKSDWQLSSLAQACSSVLPSLSTLDQLFIYEDSGHQPLWQDDVEDTQWLELLRPFIAVKKLYLSKRFGSCLARAVQMLTGDRVTEVLPALQFLYLETSIAPVLKALEPFITARRLSGHAVDMDSWSVSSRKPGMLNGPHVSVERNR
ncbi:hypothetical protein BC827DRAFT_1263848 [Russula dissimulans]|nr:hypothetical protein BC827DRAFT_1263848 [Russula dissimulans]